MATATINNPDGISCTLQFTMKIEDWKDIRETLRKNPAYTELQVINEITDLVDQLEKTLYAGVS